MGGAGGRLPAEEGRRGRVGRGFVSVSLIFQRDESATRRPPPAPPSAPAGFPTLSPALVGAPYGSRALKAAALSGLSGNGTPSGGVRANRAGRRSEAGPRRRSPRAPERPSLPT